MLLKQVAKHYKENSLDDWVRLFSGMYRKVNRDRLPAILWLEAIDEATKLAEEARKNRPNQVLKRAVTMFGWLCGFVGKYTIDVPSNELDPIGDLMKRPPMGDDGQFEESLGKWIWTKYPGHCPVCAGERCLCPSYRKLAEDRHTTDLADMKERLASPDTAPAQREFLKKKIEEQEHFDRLRKIWRARVAAAKRDGDRLRTFLAKPLDRQVDVFIDIYAGSHFDLDLLQITSKLLEEMGEAAREIIAMSELWEVRNRLRLGTLEEGDRQALKRSLHGLVAGNSDRLPPDYVAGMIGMIHDGLPEALECLCIDSASSLKGELADVFSWLTAIFCKVGTDLCEYRQVRTWHQFSDMIRSYHEEDQGTLRCPECGETACDRVCLWVHISETILKDRMKEHRRERPEAQAAPNQGTGR